jgi:hypothetical protein
MQGKTRRSARISAAMKCLDRVADKQKRLAKIREARVALEAEAKAAAGREAKRRQDAEEKRKREGCKKTAEAPELGARCQDATELHRCR